MSDEIPFHIQEEIMRRLPVKSLVQFRSVSKAWKYLIDSSEFIAAHSLHRHTHHLLVLFKTPEEEVSYVSLMDDETLFQQTSPVPNNPPPYANTSLIPSMSLTMKGEGQFFIYDPVIVISTSREVVYCLAVIKSTELNIIGQNFMTGYRIVFDREELVLGWKKSDCYDIDNSTDWSSKPLNPNNVPPAVAAGLDGHREKSNNGGRTSGGRRFIVGGFVIRFKRGFAVAYWFYWLFCCRFLYSFGLKTSR